MICNECYDSLRAADQHNTCPVCSEAIGELELLGEKETNSPSLRWFQVVLLTSYGDKVCFKTIRFFSLYTLQYTV